ncbi:hypothetical protein BGY98DRAFT_929414, partial [Russula aff. rugulosa BPL654]
PRATSLLKMVFIIIWNVAGEFVSPKNMTVGSNSPSGVRKAAFHSSPGLIRILLYPQRTSNLVNSVASCCQPGLSFGPGQRAGARKCPRSTLLQRNQRQRGGNMDINLPASQVRPARWHIALTILIGTEAQD